MSDFEQLTQQLHQQATRLQRDSNLYTVAAERIEELDALLDKNLKRENEMHVALKQIAALAHHGGLLGFSDISACHAEIRRISLRWWDKSECSRLQREVLKRT